MAPSPFRPALVIVDFQEDFCPPNGSLAVPDGRSIAPTINSLLSLPFVIRVATKDWHPANHISFASNHEPPDNKPFESKITITNPENPQESQPTLLWPVHCVQGTPGANLVPELNMSRVDHVVEKGQDARLEMYSAFAAPFSEPQVARSGLAELLKGQNVTHVYVVGLAFDYCVRCTAVDAAKEGFETFVVREGTRPVDLKDKSREEVEGEFERDGAPVVGIEGKEVGWVRELVGKN